MNMQLHNNVPTLPVLNAEMSLIYKRVSVSRVIVKRMILEDVS